MVDNENVIIDGQKSWTKHETFGVISLVLAILSIILIDFCWIPIYGIVLAIVALLFSILATIFGSVSKKGNNPRIMGVKKAGTIIGIIGIVLSAIAVILAILFSTVLAALIMAALGLAEELSSASTAAIAILL